MTLQDFRTEARGGRGTRGLPGNDTGDGNAQSHARDDRSGGPGGGPPESAATGATPAAAAASADLHVAGAHGRGPARSQVIYEAASRGFAARPYADVHSDYARHAESELERDEIPAGYRFYVRRYFQMIRPREDVHE
jgi:hypothetical protein